RNKMKLAATIGLVFVFVSISFAQANGTIAGTVILRGSPVPETAVSLTSVVDTKLKFTTVTDTSGNYTLSDIPAGTYRIDFSSDSVAGVTRQQGLDWRGEIRLIRGENKVLN